MSTKSYTLADGTTATVNATDNGVPFNEGMNVLSKAIKAKINTVGGGTPSGGSGKQEGVITVIDHYGDTVQNDSCPNDGVFTVSSNSGSTIYWHQEMNERIATISSGDTIQTNERSYEYFFTMADDNFTAASFCFYSED